MTTHAHDEIRPYGPGKFDTVLDAYIYDLSLNGCDDELGDSATTGWYGLLRGFTVDGPLSDVSGNAQLTRPELDVLRRSAGAIISEDSQGFVSVEYYTTLTQLDEAWDAIVADIESTEEDG